MKKNRIFALGMSALMVCTSVTAALAAEDQDGNPANYSPMPVSTNTAGDSAETDPAAQSFRLGAKATVKSVQEKSGVYPSILIETEEGQEIQLNLHEGTLFVDNETGTMAQLADLKEGDTIFAYYSAVMTRSLPPQSACELILVNVGDKTPASLHEVGTVTEEEDGRTAILNAAGDMIIRTDEKTSFLPYATRNIVTAEDLTPGTRFLAWYDIVALSYPGQAYTERVVVLPAEDAKPAETEDAPADARVIPENSSSGESSASRLTIVANGKTLESAGTLYDGKSAIVPVRAVAEALGCTVSYEQKDGKEYVTVENDARTMTLTVGEDLYISASNLEGMVGMTSPTQLGAAPVITDGITYAPADLFKVLVGFDVAVADDTVTITAQQEAK